MKRLEDDGERTGVEGEGKKREEEGKKERKIEGKMDRERNRAQLLL